MTLGALRDLPTRLSTKEPGYEARVGGARLRKFFDLNVTQNLELLMMLFLSIVTIIIDVLDYYYLTVGTPEVAGLTTIQAIEIVRGLKGLNLIGGDLVEVS